MVRIHGMQLAVIVACPVRVLVVHIERNADFSEDAGVRAHVVKALLLNGAKLVPYAVSNGRLTDLDGEGR